LEARSGPEERAAMVVQVNNNQNFDVDSVLGVLKGINEQYPEGTREDEALRVAAVALLFVRESQRLDEYREFFRSFYTPAVDYVVVARTFVERQEAEDWIARGEARDGDLVRIDGQGFQVMPGRRGGKQTLLRTPLPEELMKKFPPESK
jgi:hypothetical protein